MKETDCVWNSRKFDFIQEILEMNIWYTKQIDFPYMHNMNHLGLSLHNGSL